MKIRYKRVSLNPNAIAFWAFGAGVGYLWTGTLRGTVIGLVVTLGISLLAELIPDRL